MRKKVSICVLSPLTGALFELIQLFSYLAIVHRTHFQKGLYNLHYYMLKGPIAVLDCI